MSLLPPPPPPLFGNVVAEGARLSAPGESGGVDCLDCGAPLQGEWCGRCGQRVRPPEPRLRDLVAEAWDEFMGVDGRATATLRLLWSRPGLLTTEYLAGRRTRYLTPLRLYLLCSVAYFFTVTTVPSKQYQALRTATARADTIEMREALLPEVRAAKLAAVDAKRRARLAGAGISVTSTTVLDTRARNTADSLAADDRLKRLPLPRGLTRRLAGPIVSISRHPGKATDIVTLAPRLFFAMVPVFALLLSLAYRSFRRSYTVHLMTALNFHAFFFTVATMEFIADLFVSGWASKALSVVGALWLMAYLPLAVQRVFGGRLWVSVARLVTVTAAYAVCYVIAIVIIVVVPLTIG